MASRDYVIFSEVVQGHFKNPFLGEHLVCEEGIYGGGQFTNKSIWDNKKPGDGEAIKISCWKCTGPSTNLLPLASSGLRGCLLSSPKIRYRCLKRRV